MLQLLKTTEEFILASGSPRRQKYFNDLGLLFHVVPADIEEKVLPAESPVNCIKRLAGQKAEHVAWKYPQHWIVAADTVVCFEDKILGKPDSKKDAIDMLLRLSGREHIVRTAVCLHNNSQSVSEICSVATRVVFWDFSEEMVKFYV